MAKWDSITAERIRELFDYNPQTGLFTHLQNRGGGAVRAGTVTGGTVCGAYLEFCIDLVRIKAHIVAWIWMTGEWPKDFLDHKDLDKHNNRWLNIRPATKTQNMINTGIRSDNVSGYKGVSWDKTRRKWVVRLRVNGTYLYLGRFDDIKEASIEYISAAKRHYGEFARIE